MPRTLLFDFDLTLADSRESVTTCARHALEVMQIEGVPDDQIHRTIGLTLQNGYRLLTGDPDEVAADRYSDEFIVKAEVVQANGVPLFDGVPEVMQELSARGHRLGIVSTKFRPRLISSLVRARMTETFEVVIGGDEVENMKPAPDALLLGLERFDVTRDQALYIGDHTVDARAARAAEMGFVGVTTGTTSADELSEYGALAVLESVSALPDFLT